MINFLNEGELWANKKYQIRYEVRNFFSRYLPTPCIVPAKNLIINIGFGHQDATHTDRARAGFEHQKTQDIIFPLQKK